MSLNCLACTVRVTLHTLCLFLCDAQFNNVSVYSDNAQRVGLSLESYTYCNDSQCIKDCSISPPHVFSIYLQGNYRHAHILLVKVIYGNFIIGKIA